MSDYPGACPPQKLRPPSLVFQGDSDDDFDITNLEKFTDGGVDKNNGSIGINRQLNHNAVAQNSAANLLIPSTTTTSSSSLSLPTMNAEDETADSPLSPGFKNPFNFQTQVISAGPVKSVCSLSFHVSNNTLIYLFRRTLDNAVDTDTNTVVSHLNIKSSKSHRRDPHLSFPLLSLSRPLARHGKA
jgi:hypothetical protein